MKKIAKIFIFLCVFSLGATKMYAQVSVGISVRIAPPELPYYVQPVCPGDGYLWQPGYWAYDDADGYYWVPGVWVYPPDPGYYWTPCYWGYVGGFYGFHRGYWGPHVGYYGGIDYGYGYGGYGFTGGQWSGRSFRYNTAVMNVNRRIVHNTYTDRSVIHNTGSRYSYNGPGGATARPRAQELTAMREHHIQPTRQQLSHQQVAAKSRGQFASVNHGKPAAAALNKVGGRAYDPQGHVSTAALGRTSRATASRPAITPARANSGAARQQQRTQQPQQRVQSQRQPQQRQQRAQQAQAQRQQRVQQAQPQRQQRVQQAQPQRQQRVQQAQQQRPQQQQRQQQQERPQQQQRQQPQQQQRPQQQRPQQQQQRPQQQQGNPREKHG